MNTLDPEKRQRLLNKIAFMQAEIESLIDHLKFDEFKGAGRAAMRISRGFEDIDTTLRTKLIPKPVECSDPEIVIYADGTNRSGRIAAAINCIGRITEARAEVWPHAHDKDYEVCAVIMAHSLAMNYVPMRFVIVTDSQDAMGVALGYRTAKTKYRDHLREIYLRQPFPIRLLDQSEKAQHSIAHTLCRRAAK